MQRHGWVLIPFLCAAAIGALGHAFAQLPWGHPFVAGATSAPCGVFTGQPTKWDSGKKGTAITLSNSDYTATLSDTMFNIGSVLGTTAHHTGKWYFLVHVDVTTLGNGFVAGVGNTGLFLGTQPASDSHSAGCYIGNYVGRGGVNNYVAAVISNGYFVIASDFDNGTSWCGQASDACTVAPSSWSGPAGLTGNPATNTDGLPLATINNGAVFPTFGGQLGGGGGTDTATLYTNTPLSDATLTGFKYWDQP